ncbi:MAG TPA: polyhydroxyalkanoic acid system family protein [Flavobacterium sp.]|uniref:polyhydroxyalkanoic acid system family protein n=1 Tax=Flavobacterium TaxID=237 RepID=UPI002ED1B47E
MSKIKVSVNHQLKHDEALSRVKKFCETAPKRFADQAYDLKFTWNGSTNNFSFKVGSAKISGTLAVNSTNAVVVCAIPFVFLLFKSQIEETVRQHAIQILKK